MSASYTQCRYMRRSGERCTAEVADEYGDVLLCVKHLARAVAMAKARTAEAKKTGAAR